MPVIGPLFCDRVHYGITAERIHLCAKGVPMPPKSTGEHSIWLCPEPTAAQPLRTQIAALTGISGTPVFEPHVTLLGDLATSPESCLRICREVFAQTGSVKARVTNVSQTESFFMALFLDLRLAPDLTDVRRRLEQSFGCPSLAYRPHLSLAYGIGPQPVDRLEKLADEYTGRDILLDRVAIVASSRHLPMEQWRVLHELPLN